MEHKDIDIQCIWSEDNPVDIMTKNTSEAYFMKHVKKITKRELWELVDTGRENVNNTRVTDHVIIRDKTGYSSPSLAEVVGLNIRTVGYWSRDIGLVSNEITNI